MENTLKAKLHKDIVIIDFSNPEYGNSFGVQQAEELLHIQSTYSQAAKGLLFCSSGSRFFCTGGNLKSYASMSAKEGIRANRKIRKALNSFTLWPVAKVAVVNGDCLGGGLELLSCFHKVFSSPKSCFGFWQRRIGLSFGWGGGNRWLRRMPLQKIQMLGLSAKTINAYHAKDLGLVDEVVLASQLSLRAGQWLLEQSQKPEAPLGFWTQDEVADETKLFERLWHNPEHKQVLERFSK